MRKQPSDRPENVLALAVAEIERIKALLSRVTDSRGLVVSTGSAVGDTTPPVETGAHTLYGVKHTRAFRVTTLSDSYAVAVLADSPVAYWRLGEVSGNFADSSGNGHTATPNGTVTYSQAGALSGDTNTAIGLPGAVTDYLSVADHADLDLGDGPFTLECWFAKDVQGTVMNLFSKGTGAYRAYSHSDNTLRLEREGVQVIASSTITITDTNWHHLVITKNGAASVIYIDGVDRTGAITDSTMVDTGDELRLGLTITGSIRPWDGELDEMAIYASVLTPAQVLEHYNIGAGGVGLVVSYEQGQIWMSGSFYTIAADRLVLTDDDTSYVFVNNSGAVADNTTGFPGDCWPMALVTTVAGAITALADRRSYSAQGVWDGTMDADEILLPVIGSPTFTHVEDLNTVYHSTGWISGAAISDAGGATIDVAAGAGAFRAANNQTAQLRFGDWAASAGLAITADSIRYIGVQDGTPPVVTVRTTYNFNLNTDFPLGTVVNEGGNLHIQFAPWEIGDHANFMIQRVRGTAPIARDKVVGGLIFSETGTRNVAVTAGALWHGLTSFTIGALDTDPGGAADTFDTYSAGGQEATGVAAWPNEQYDNAGVLTNMTPNRWANLWWYLELDGELVMVYGTNQYTSAALAGEEAAPSILPNRLQVHGVLAARFIFQKSAGTAEEILSAFDTQFSVLGVTDHGNLTGLTDSVDHAWALLIDGTRPLTGNWTTGAFDIGNYDNTIKTEKVEIDDALYALDIVASNPRINYDTNDYAEFNRAGNYYTWVIGSTEELRLTATALLVDVINELTGAAGTTIEDVTNKDGSIELHHGTDTIASDEITAPTGGYIIAAAQAGVTDDLDGIGGGAYGRIIVVRADAGDTITVKHNDAGGGAGRKILLNDNTDLALVGNDEDNVTLMYDESLLSAAGAWFEISRGEGGAGGCDLSAYAITNVTTDRAYDADATSIDELADVLGTLISDLDGCVGAGGLPGTRAYRGSTYSIPNSTSTVVPLDAENYDDDGWHDPAVNPSRITVDADGRYLLYGAVTWAYNNTGMRVLQVYLNGVQILTNSAHPTVTTSSWGAAQEASTIYELNNGDYIELRVRQDSGGALNVAAGVGGTSLTVQRI